MLYEQKKGSIVAVCSWNGTAFQFALGSSMDVRPFSKTLNQQLNGRGRGSSSLMVQGMWNAMEDEISMAVLELSC